MTRYLSIILCIDLLRGTVDEGNFYKIYAIFFHVLWKQTLQMNTLSFTDFFWVIFTKFRRYSFMYYGNKYCKLTPFPSQIFFSVAVTCFI